MAEIKGKRLITSQKILLSLFDDLKTIFNNNNNNNNKSNSNVNENESKNENENEIENESEYESENENEKKWILLWNKTIDQTKSLEEQIELLRESG